MEVLEMMAMMAQGKTMLTAVAAMAILVGCAGMTPVMAQAAGTQPARPVRVRAKLDGFDLTPKSAAAPARRPNQIGGASRGLGDMALYAPTMGKSYTLTPEFFWRSDDVAGEYTFRVSQPGMNDAPIFETKVVGGHFVYPTSAPTLKPGETYVWTVQPVVDMMGGPVSASVVIVGGSEREAVKAALDKASDPTAKAKVFVDMRLWFDAVGAYTTLIEKSPRGEYYQARADLYDQVPATSTLADADAAKAHK
jgi:hypothetical protein